jgi:uncharacterized protein (DUF2235 family)
MPKNLVVCCDGTANEFSIDKTNVVKLYSVLDRDATRQRIFYHPGIGTMEPPGALTGVSRFITRVAALGFGYGLKDDIANAYKFIMNFYEPGDDIYLFGFSRGAFTVRAVASLIRRYGLIRPGNESLVPYAIRMLTGLEKARKEGESDAGAMSEYFKLSGEFRHIMSWTDCDLKFVGVWDTVSSVGWVDRPLRLPDTADNPGIHYGRHAIAIDERRTFFRQNLWRPRYPAPRSGPRDLKQVWFPGVHCDVGGGYPQSESGLADVTLEWMLREAKLVGLLVDPDKELSIVGAAGSWLALKRYDAQAHESLVKWWKIAEYIPKDHWNYKTQSMERYANHGDRRVMPDGSLVHRSAELRHGGQYKRILPLDVVFVD